MRFEVGIRDRSPASFTGYAIGGAHSPASAVCDWSHAEFSPEEEAAVLFFPAFAADRVFELVWHLAEEKLFYRMGELFFCYRASSDIIVYFYVFVDSF